MDRSLFRCFWSMCCFLSFDFRVLIGILCFFCLFVTISFTNLASHAILKEYYIMMDSFLKSLFGWLENSRTENRNANKYITRWENYFYIDFVLLFCFARSISCNASSYPCYVTRAQICIYVYASDMNMFKELQHLMLKKKKLASFFFFV